MFKAGYIYKPTHLVIHYIRRNAIFNRRLGYDKKFTLNPDEAMIYEDEFNAKSAIDYLMPPSPPTYDLTPVTVNIKTGEMRIHTPFRP